MPSDEWITTTREALATRMRLAKQREQRDGDDDDNAEPNRAWAAFDELSIPAEEYR